MDAAVQPQRPYTQGARVVVPEQFAQRNAARAQQKAYTPKPQVKIPEEFAQRNAARAQQKAAPVKKQKGKGGLIAVVSLVLVAAIVLGVFGFRDGGWFRGSGNDTSSGNESASYNSMQNVEAIKAYAERLEDEGNYEAAAQVWALLPAAAEAAAVEDAKKAIEDTPEMQAYKAMKESRDIASAMQGGKGE